MLVIYRRHLTSGFGLDKDEPCPHSSKGRQYRRCSCPIWVQGTINGEKVRKSLDLTNWEKATEAVRDMELTGTVLDVDEDDRLTVADAIARFMADAKARNLAEGTLKKYVVLLGPPRETAKKERKRSPTLMEFAEDKGVRYLNELDTDLLREFRASWLDKPLAASKKLERLRSFFRFAADSDWIAKSPAKAIKPPVTRDEAPTLPFTDEELGRLYSALPEFVRKRRESARGPDADHMECFPALLLALEYSGLRIGDAVGLSKDDLVGDKLWVDTVKTGTKVFIPLPPHVICELHKLTLNKGRFYFWSGNGAVSTAAGNYRRTLRALAATANVRDAHPHRFRDTLAVRLLTEGVPLERVAKILGHRSVRVTERSYSPWVKALQETLEADVRRVWDKASRPKLVRVK